MGKTLGTARAEEDIQASTSTKSARGPGRPKSQWQSRLQIHRKHVNTLSVANKRLRRKNEILLSSLNILEEEHELQQSQLSILDNGLEELIDNEMRNCHVSRHSARTIQRWFEVDCKPGFNTETMNIAVSHAGSKLYSLVIDSMSIWKQVIVQNKKVFGHCDYGGVVGAADKEAILANEALVFLLVPLIGQTRFPIGYFLVDKIDSMLQSSLILRCLRLTAEKGIQIVNITCDGCAANIATLTKLEATIPERPWFQHPSAEYQVTTTLDPVHMLKVARNAWATYHIFHGPDGPIDYSDVEKLVNKQEEEGVKFGGNKLGKRHLSWKNVRMKVRLAAKVLSTSTADSLEYFSKVDGGFKDAGPTISFIRKMDRLFDILNCHKPFYKGPKSLLNRVELSQIENNFSSLMTYLNSLTMSTGKPLNCSGRKTFITGFQSASKTFITFGRRLFEEFSELKYLMA